MSRGGRRTRRRRPRGETTDKQPPVHPFPSPFTDWGGELWFVIDYTAGGAPIGLRVSEIEDVFEHCELDHPSPWVAASAADDDEIVKRDGQRPVCV